jgi:hypothetical protein
MRNPSLKITISFLLFLSFFISVEGGQITKTYPKKESVRLKAILGSCSVIQSKDDSIHTDVRYSFKGDEYHAVFSDFHDSLILEEEFHEKSPVGSSSWIIAVPADTKLLLSSATGNISVEGVQSEVKAETGTGSVEINTSSGKFDLGSGTGNVNGTGLIIHGSSKFASGTGRVNVSIACGSDYDITVASGMGDAILDYHGNPLKGIFTFIAKHDLGRIISPVKFEKEEITSDDHFSYDRKSFQVGDQTTPCIRIEAGNGEAVLVK